MFRLFLINKLASEESSPSRPKLPSKQFRNRRLYERFDIDHKHLALLNDQDILNVRNISTSGFSCEVGERAFERLQKGDLYQCRVRYLREIFDLKAQVAWKSKPFVGFAIEEPSPIILKFLERIIRPARIGSSLQEVETTLPNIEIQGHPLQFQGDDESRLLIWEDKSHHLQSWTLELSKSYIQWSSEQGLETGTLLEQKSKSLSDPWNPTKKKEERANPSMVQLALDIFMTLNFPRSQNLIESLHKKT